MRSVFVVVFAPILQLFSCIRKAQEPVCIQALRPEPSVEGFNESVVGRLSRAGEVQRDTFLVTP